MLSPAPPIPTSDPCRHLSSTALDLDAVFSVDRHFKNHNLQGKRFDTYLSTPLCQRRRLVLACLWSASGLRFGPLWLLGFLASFSLHVHTTPGRLNLQCNLNLSDRVPGCIQPSVLPPCHAPGGVLCGFVASLLACCTIALLANRQSVFVP
ncbi:hypothetical protein BGZ61DRAFT_443254 [Ilyonectria robusta]|uniref:uncharacterized protein n=1 Tax=Ilyonectria robusta TaxID=1079257 RepID=UPI001E8D8D5F|nr:uncharacterized protein BGZ61DRAFT_443254 [Ilyonectria robusta]KAH8734854.1 hypothetical protein BGZ61DRAFT_443254 [Ilyonectria robusta]